MLDKFISLLRDVSNKGFFHLFTANLVITILGFGSQLLVVKFLSPADVGNIKTIQSFITVASILAGFGFNTAVLKLCSERRDLEEKAYILKVTAFYSLFPIVIVTVAIVLISKLNIFSPVEEINDLMNYYMLVLPAGVFASLFMAYLQALKKIKTMAKMQVIIRVFGLFFLVIFTYFFQIKGYIFSTVAFTTIAVIPLIYLVKNDFKNIKTINNINSKVFYYAKWSLAANIMHTINSLMDIFVLNYMIADRVSLGYYTIATIFVMALNQITSTVQSITTPYFSDKSTDKNEFLRVLVKYQKIMVLGSLLITLITMIIIPTFIVFVYGTEYALSGKIFIVLSLKNFFMSCYAILGVAILGLGKMKYNFYSMFISTIITMLANIVFINWLGVFGAAIAQAVSCLIILGIMVAMTIHVVNLHFNAIDKNTISAQEMT